MHRLVKILLFSLAGFGSLPTTAQNWQEVNGGLEYPADDWVVDTVNNWLYMYGGAKYVQDTLQINGFGRFDGTQWHQLPLIDTACVLVCNNFYAIEYYAGDIYLSYELDPWEFIGSVGRFDGTNFQYDFAVTDTNGGITAMEVIDGKLWCVGGFNTLNGLPISNIGIWDGTQWTTIDNPGFAPYASDIQEYQGNVYVCGNIHHPEMTEILMWDGQEWSAVGGGLTENGWVNTMAVYQGELYVGGNFWKDWGAPDNNIAKWNGTEWSEVGGGTSGIGSPNGQVTDLLVHEGYLYACGQFQYAGGIRSDYFARWDGNEWCVMGTAMTGGYVGELVEFQGEIIASGGFQVINGDSITRLAKWSGGGWTDSCGVVSNVAHLPLAGRIEVYPNPATEKLSVQLPASPNPYRIELRDVYGRLEVLRPSVRPESGAEVIYTSHFSPGIYFLTVIGDFGQRTQKVILAGPQSKR